MLACSIEVSDIQGRLVLTLGGFVLLVIKATNWLFSLAYTGSFAVISRDSDWPTPRFLKMISTQIFHNDC